MKSAHISWWQYQTDSWGIDKGLHSVGVYEFRRLNGFNIHSESQWDAFNDVGKL